MVGSYIRLETKSSLHLRHRKVFFNLNRRLEESADELNIPLTVYDKLFGSKADHKSFRSFTKKNRSSFQVAFFHSEKDSKFIPIDSMNFPSKEIR